MKELDLLKKDWKKKENAFEQISEKELYKMIHKKSSSIVKWIFIISILEIFFWISISFLFNTGSDITDFQKSDLVFFLEILTYINYGVVLVFIWLFYKNYATISATVSTKQLMKDILKTRKTVQYYVWYNLGIIIISMIIGIILLLSYSPETIAFKEHIMKNSSSMAISIFILVIVFASFFGFFWLFYRLLYGVLLRKLYANYNELRKIDL